MREPNWQRLLEAGTVAGITIITIVLISLIVVSLIVVTLIIAEWLFLAAFAAVYAGATWYIYTEFTEEDESWRNND